MSAEYDAIVVGLGAMGSAAAYQLASRGLRVLGLDAHEQGHTLGSSHGESRIIRMAYMEHPDYVPLLRRAYELWREVEAQAGVELLRQTGGLFLGPPEGSVVGGSLQSARLHHLPHEMLDGAEVQRRYPALHPGPDDVALFEEAAGVLFSEQCIQAQLRLATKHGAQIQHNAKVQNWEATSGGVSVVTDGVRYTAGHVVFAAGAWMGKLLANPPSSSRGPFGKPQRGFRLPLKPERQTVWWLHPRERPELFDPARFPIYIWEASTEHSFYGFPHLGWPGVKVGRHHSGEYGDPDTISREVVAADELAVRAFVRRHIPALDGDVASALVCLYTNTPDEHFVVDRHPEHPGVVYASACSGHGFKFASVIGEVLADLVTTGQANPAANFLRAERLVGARA